MKNETDIEVIGIEGFDAYKASRVLKALGFKEVAVTCDHPTDLWEPDAPILDIEDYIDLEGFRYPEIGFGDSDLPVILMMNIDKGVAFFIGDDGVAIAHFWRECCRFKDYFFDDVKERG